MAFLTDNLRVLATSSLTQQTVGRVDAPNHEPGSCRVGYVLRCYVIRNLRRVRKQLDPSVCGLYSPHDDEKLQRVGRWSDRRNRSIDRVYSDNVRWLSASA